MVGVVRTELLRAVGGGRVGKRIGSNSAGGGNELNNKNKTLNLSSDMASGVNQFFIEGVNTTVLIVADGSHVGQTLGLRKIATLAYTEPVRIRIKHLSLESNTLGTCLMMNPSVYTLHFCWDGDKWCQDIL
jgi:hypothetical protein